MRCMALPSCRWLVLLSMLVCAPGAFGQFEGYGGCIDFRGLPVATYRNVSVQDVAVAGSGPRGEPIISYNPLVLKRFSPIMGRFWYMHECGHHALAHAVRRIPLSQEQEADCFAIVVLVERGEFGPDEVRQVQSEFQQIPVGDWQHLPGPIRAMNLDTCLRTAHIDASTGGRFGKSAGEEDGERSQVASRLRRSPSQDAFSSTVRAILAIPDSRFFAAYHGRPLPDTDLLDAYESRIDLPGASSCTLFGGDEGTSSLMCLMHKSTDASAAEDAYDEVVRAMSRALPASQWTRDETEKSTSTYDENETEFTMDDAGDEWASPPFANVTFLQPHRIDRSKRWGLYTVVVNFFPGLR